jgi:hypothetical protein
MNQWTLISPEAGHFMCHPVFSTVSFGKKLFIFTLLFIKFKVSEKAL